jgi:hypothetical protein
MVELVQGHDQVILEMPQRDVATGEQGPTSRRDPRTMDELPPDRPELFQRELYGLPGASGIPWAEWTSNGHHHEMSVRR